MVETVVAAPYVGAMMSFAAHPNCLPLAELEGKMPLAADEVLLYPRRRRYFVSICIGFAGTKIYSRRGEHYSPVCCGFPRAIRSG